MTEVMDFGDSPAQATLRAEIRTWLAERVPTADDSSASSGFFDVRDGPEVIVAARTWQAVKADAGWGCLPWPVEYGGRGGSVVDQLIWDQEEARFATPPNIFAIGLGMVGPTLIEHGTADQKRAYVRPLLRGDELWCQMFSEPGAGSDLAAVRTRAARSGTDWVLTGQKTWTSRAHYTDRGFLLARSDPGSVGAKGLTCFLVDMRAPGIDARPIQQIDGRKTFCDVFLDEVRVPDGDRLGDAGDGWSVLMTTLANERMFIGSRGERDATHLLSRLVHLARELPTPRGTPVHDVGVRRRLADFHVRVRLLDLARYRAVTQLAIDGKPSPAGAIAKLAYGTLMQEMAGFGLELLADATSIAADPLRADWEYTFMRSPSLRIGGGTDEIQRNAIAERLLGLPKAPRAGR